MSHILILNECPLAGVPVWRFAASRDEAVYVYEPRELGDREEEPSSTPNVWMRTFWKPWAAVDRAGYLDEEYAVYLPCSEKDFTSLWHDDRGPFRVAAPSELAEERAQAFSLIDSKVRPLRYLQRANFCSELEMPWVYLSGIYIETNISLFIAESEDMIAAVRELTKGVEGCEMVSAKDVASWEKYDWRSHYDQREEKPRLTDEQKETMREGIEVIREWVERHNDQVKKGQ